MGKIKAQSIRCNQRPRLFHMRTEHSAQNSMQNVGGCMIQRGCPAFGSINLKAHFVALFYFAGNYFSFVNNESGGIFNRIANFHFKIFSADLTHIPDLTAGFSIKRSFFRNQFNELGSHGFRDFGTIGDNQQNFRFEAQRLITFKFRFKPARRQFFISITDRCESRHRPGSPPLPGHGVIKPIHIKSQIFVPHNIPHDIGRKAVSVIELENNIPGHLSCAFGLDLSERIV